MLLGVCDVHYSLLIRIDSIVFINNCFISKETYQCSASGIWVDEEGKTGLPVCDPGKVYLLYNSLNFTKIEDRIKLQLQNNNVVSLLIPK